MSRTSYRTHLTLIIAAALPLLSAPPAGGQGRLDSEREAAAIEFLTNGVPELAQQFRELKRERPDEYFQELRRGLLEQADVERTRVEEPERYRQFMAERKLDRGCFELARQVRDTEGEARESLVRELERTVGELFDLRESWRSQEIEMLERELARLRDEGTQRRRQRDVIVQRRIEELTGRAELYAW